MCWALLARAGGPQASSRQTPTKQSMSRASHHFYPPLVTCCHKQDPCHTVSETELEISALMTAVTCCLIYTMLFLVSNTSGGLDLSVSWIATETASNAVPLGAGAAQAWRAVVMQWRAFRATHLHVGKHRGRQIQLLHPRSLTMGRCEVGAAWQKLISSQGSLRIPLRCAKSLLCC